eukprot:6184845-Pleurochrysis_carterae.AAC.1
MRQWSECVNGLDDGIASCKARIDTFSATRLEAFLCSPQFLVLCMRALHSVCLISWGEEQRQQPHYVAIARKQIAGAFHPGRSHLTVFR